jgi:sigma-B regulation protein RsbQ
VQIVQSDGVDIAVRQSGDGAVSVVFVHGFQNSSAAWSGVMSRLGDRINGVALDLPGCGASSRPADWARCTVDHYARDVANVIEALGLERPVLVGHSLGGGAVLRLALDQPELARALVLVAPISTTGLDFLSAEQIDALADPTDDDALALARAAFFRPPSDEVFALVMEAVHTASREHIQGAARSMAAFDVADQLSTLAVPALLVAGDRDRHVPLRNHLATWARIRRCGLQVFHQVGHVPFDEVPDAFDEVLLRFCGQFAGEAAWSPAMWPNTAPDVRPVPPG